MSELHVERSDGIVTVALNRPGKKNAINIAMWRELFGCFDEIGRSGTDRCVVLTGSGEEFSSGADVEDFPTPADVHWVPDVLLALRDLPQPTIAKIRGIAAGAAMNLALACDMVVAAEEARFSEIFIRRALCPDTGGTWILPRLVGLHKAKELALLGHWVLGGEAAAMGLINRAVPESQLDKIVEEWAGELAAGPPTALAQTKRLLNQSSVVTLPEALAEEEKAQMINFNSPEFSEAVTAFMQRRPPVYGSA